jgi:hypothetical protein
MGLYAGEEGSGIVSSACDDPVGFTPDPCLTPASSSNEVPVLFQGHDMNGPGVRPDDRIWRQWVLAE